MLACCGGRLINAIASNAPPPAPTAHLLVLMMVLCGPPPLRAGATAIEDPQQAQGALSGEEMRQLSLAKYGKTYDVSLVRRDGFGKSFVALNVTWQHLEQRSFRLTEEQYMEKISR